MVAIMRSVLAAVALLTFTSACGPASSGTGASSGRSAAAPAGQKRIVTSVTTDPPSLYYAAIPAPVRPEIGGTLSDFLHPGLTTVDAEGAIRALLAESVPAL